ncbi:MAG: hypothetical protein HYZ26_00860 [Chloroflexi bacterium]|nr:hypothetical protein [Chloroflexota bacterium]
MNLRAVRPIAIGLLLLTAGCSLFGPSEAAGPATPQATGQVQVVTTSVPSAESAAEAYLAAWAAFDYETMYGLLTQLSRDALPYEQFDARYTAVALEATLTEVKYELLSSLVNPANAQVAYRVTLVSALVGEITRDTVMYLSLEGGVWQVVWDDALILPELAGGNTLSMQRFEPTRGIIYDRDGDVLAGDAEAVAVQVIPSNVEEDAGGGLASQLATLTGQNALTLSETIFAEDAPFLVPIGVVSADDFARRESFLEPYFNYIRFDRYFTRLYSIGNAGAHAIGYVGRVSAEEAEELARQGVPIDAVVGKQGVERWAETYLSGQRGGELYVVSPEGQRVTILARRDAQPSQSVYLTLDRDLQRQTQAAIRDFNGAIVVLERDTGRILAIASSPTFDPNSADFTNPISQWNTYFPDDRARFFNRATQGQYPPGSIFKMIPLAAALESGLYNRQSNYFCGHTWTGLGEDSPLNDWTLEKELPPSGELTLLQALTRSCNPWFYEIGLSLYSSGYPDLVAELARGFGLGRLTGLGVLPEEAGQITTPDTSTTGSEPPFNATQQAIGQSDTLVTPLQMAVYIAALGNGGTLYQPALIEQVLSTDGQASLTFEPTATGTLPISAETLQAIQEALRSVVNDPRGTAYRRFSGFSIAVYGKTGTAQVGAGILPHAWFIGYTNQNRADLPDIAIAVLVENIGEGSDFAAPIFKRVVESYFFGSPQSRYPWETQIGVFDPEFFNPTPEGEEGTPTDEDGPIEVTPSP